MGELSLVNENYMSMVERVATDPNVDVGKMREILDMQERIFDKNAEIDFNKCMTECQSEMPVITKDSENKQTASRYAKYETIIKDTKPIYTKHGFSVSFSEGDTDKEGYIRINGEIMHKGGFTKKYFTDIAMDDVGIKGVTNKTQVHAKGSSFSYGKRYLFCLIFNITISDEDDDGNKASQLNLEDILSHVQWVRDNFDLVHEIKEGIANDDLERSAMAWLDMTESDLNMLWRAPTKGGILTTFEREVMSSTRFREAGIAVRKGSEK